MALIRELGDHGGVTMRYVRWVGLRYVRIYPSGGVRWAIEESEAAGFKFRRGSRPQVEIGSHQHRDGN